MRRRKPKVVWLPCTNTFSTDPGLRTTWQVTNGPLDTTAPGNGATLELPVVQDFTDKLPTDAEASLADMESTGYRLRRIVGKVYVFLSQPGPGLSGHSAVVGVTAGLIIRSVATATGASMASAFGQANVDDLDNSMDPWIWRRSWLLGISDTIAAGGLQFRDIPAQNFANQYPGGNSEGPHVDQKTARIVGNEERLFLNVTARTIFNSINPDFTPSLVVMSELRALASMRVNQGNRRNASR